MKFVKPLAPYEVFTANLEAGNHEQLMIRDLVESFGLHVSNRHRPGNIAAVSALDSIYKKYGYHVLSRVLRLCIGAWEGDENSFSANILNGIAKLVVVYAEALKDETFKEKLGNMSIKALSRQAKERRPGSLGYAEAMIVEYNGRKKNSTNRLLLSKLYARERTMFKDEFDEDYADDEYEENYDFDDSEDSAEDDLSSRVAF
jgi:hypothetical protein